MFGDKEVANKIMDINFPGTLETEADKKEWYCCPAFALTVQDSTTPFDKELRT